MRKTTTKRCVDFTHLAGAHKNGEGYSERLLWGEGEIQARFFGGYGLENSLQALSLGKHFSPRIVHVASNALIVAFIPAAEHDLFVDVLLVFIQMAHSFQ